MDLTSAERHASRARTTELGAKRQARVSETDAVLILETDGGGHRFRFVRLLILHALNSGKRVFLCLAPASCHRPEYEVHVSDLVVSGQVVAYKWHNWRQVEQLSRQLKASVTVVPDGDRHLSRVFKRLTWRGYGELSILMLRDPWEKSGAGIQPRHCIKRWMIRSLARFRRVRVSILASSSTRFDNAQPPRQRLVVDPITYSATPRSVIATQSDLRLDSDTYWLGVIGAVTPRKNLPEILQAVILSNLGNRIGVLVAGDISPQVYETCLDPLRRARAQGIKVVLRDGVMGESEFDSCVGAVDCLLLAHSNEGPSGVFGKAMLAGTRVVAAGAQSLKRDCLAYPDSAQWVSLSAYHLSAALQNVITKPRPQPNPYQGSAHAFGDALLFGN